MNINQLKEWTSQALLQGLQVETKPEEISWEAPPNPTFGDLSTPVSLKLAKILRRKPLDIAHDLAAALQPLLPKAVDA